MSHIIKFTLPCPMCKSSDGYHKYSDGHGYCFACAGYEHDLFGNHPSLQDQALSKQRIAYRGITTATMEKYGVFTLVNQEGVPTHVSYPYSKGEYKVKSLVPCARKDKYKTIKGGQGGLCGTEVFSSGQAKACTICEGEDDMLSAFQMLGSRYPVFSVHSSASAMRDCKAAFEYLDKFDQIYLCLDNDEQGIKATAAIASLFDNSKIYFVKMTKHKDANAYLQAGESKEFTSIWWAAERWKPVGIVSTYKEIDDILAGSQHETLCSYPFPTLQEMTYGIQSSEFILFTAFTGIGKTEIIRAIEYHIIKTTEHNIGIIHIEEGEKRSIEGLVGYHWGAPAHHPVANFLPKEISNGYKELVKTEDRVYFYKHYGSDDPSVFTSTIRYMATGCDCKIITLDHISKIVSGWDTDDERKTIDMLCTQLDNICQETGVALLMVSHVNDNGLTRGSRNIAQTAHTHVHLSRDMDEIDPVLRNTTKLIIRKNRDGSLTGPAGQLLFDRHTFMIKETVEGTTQQEVPF